MLGLQILAVVNKAGVICSLYPHNLLVNPVLLLGIEAL